MLSPKRQSDKRSHRGANLKPHVSHVAKVQIAQHEDGEKRRRHVGAERQATAENDEFEKIAFAEATQKHDKSEVAGRILFVRRLIHPADEISGEISSGRGQSKDNPETCARR